jgi:hypothetical protein
MKHGGELKPNKLGDCHLERGLKHLAHRGRLRLGNVELRDG